MSYKADAKEDAKEMIFEFMNEIIEQIIQGEKVSDDLFNDYSSGDSYFHEKITDRGYYLDEAAKVLEELPQFEETDSGLWQGLDAKDAIPSMAAYTYGNAVMHFWKFFIQEINEEIGLDEILEEKIKKIID